jgi:CheY-like chemotaxis protein
MAEPRILLVEDEPIVAMSFAAILQEEGYEVVGPVGSIDQALEIIGRERHSDGALLDLNLRGQAAEPIADALERRGPGFDLSAAPRMRQFQTGSDMRQ